MLSRYIGAHQILLSLTYDKEELILLHKGVMFMFLKLSLYAAIFHMYFFFYSTYFTIFTKIKQSMEQLLLLL